MKPIRFRTETEFVKGNKKQSAEEILDQYDTVDLEVVEGDMQFKKFIIESNQREVLENLERKLKKRGVELSGLW